VAGAPEAPRAEAKENQTYCSKLIRSSQATPTETAKAAPLTDGDTMSTATRTDTQSPALHVADRHDLIRVHGARENNLKDVSVELPKRRLTRDGGLAGGSQ
jgi:excinuclease UvrABC ATPase subunit